MIHCVGERHSRGLRVRAVEIGSRLVVVHGRRSKAAVHARLRWLYDRFANALAGRAKWYW